MVRYPRIPRPRTVVGILAAASGQGKSLRRACQARRMRARAGPLAEHRRARPLALAANVFMAAPEGSRMNTARWMRGAAGVVLLFGCNRSERAFGTERGTL